MNASVLLGKEKKVLENLPSTHTFNFISSDAWQEIFATLAKHTAKKINFMFSFERKPLYCLVLHTLNF